MSRNVDGPTSLLLATFKIWMTGTAILLRNRLAHFLYLGSLFVVLFLDLEASHSLSVTAVPTYLASMINL
uniref:Uncharacterized protein n=1 Tax=Acartia pacifica TaxID=335913 RepID=A0A0U2V6D2_ACAPC|nr:hypothetical protein [Acartia pacifica]